MVEAATDKFQVGGPCWWVLCTGRDNL